MNVYQTVFDDGQSKEEADQQGIKTGHEEERVAQFKEIVGHMQNQADDEHGADAYQKIEDLQTLAGDLGLAVRKDEIQNTPTKISQTNQAQDPGQNVRFQGAFEGKDVVKDGADLQDPPDIDLEQKDKRN